MKIKKILNFAVILFITLLSSCSTNNKKTIDKKINSKVLEYINNYHQNIEIADSVTLLVELDEIGIVKSISEELKNKYDINTSSIGSIKKKKVSIFQDSLEIFKANDFKNDYIQKRKEIKNGNFEMERKLENNKSRIFLSNVFKFNDYYLLITQILEGRFSIIGTIHILKFAENEIELVESIAYFKSQ